MLTHCTNFVFQSQIRFYLYFNVSISEATPKVQSNETEVNAEKNEGMTNIKDASNRTLSDMSTQTDEVIENVKEINTRASSDMSTQTDFPEQSNNSMKLNNGGRELI